MAGKPTLATAWIGLIPTLSGSQKAIEDELGDVDTAPAGEKAGKKYGKALGAGALVAGALIVKGLSTAVTDASDLNESVNAVQVSFGNAADGVLELSKNSATAVGLSSQDFNTLAVQFSAFSTAIAGEGGDVAGTLGDITGRAADFASVMNLEVSDAAQIFQSGLAGESEPLRKFGIDLSAASVEAYAYANGIAEAGKPLTEQQKVQARYGSLMEQTAKTQGDFTNTSDGLANSQRILKANVTNLSAQIGTALLPVIAKLSGAIIPIVQFLGRNQGILVALGIVIGVTLVAAFVAWTASVWAANAALLANPITWIILGIIALIAIVVLLVKNWDTVWAAIKAGWDKIAGFFAKGWEAVKSWLGKVWEFIKKVWSYSPLGLIVTNWDKITGFIAGVRDKVIGYFKAAWEFIKKIWHWTPYGVIADNWDKIIGFFKNIPSRVSAAFGKVRDAIIGAFKSAFNWVARGWNDTIGSLNFTVPDIPGLPGRGETFEFPRIPYLADGGIVTAATLAMVGEGGEPEVVSPLSKLPDVARAMGVGGEGLTRDDLEYLGQFIVSAIISNTRGEVAKVGRAVAAGVRF